ncbi:hypothetical protein WAI453_006169 [Rhynchosporium graminicola]
MSSNGWDKERQDWSSGSSPGKINASQRGSGDTMLQGSLARGRKINTKNRTDIN